MARIVVALGNDFESANAAAMYHARLVVHDDEQASGEEQKELQAARDGVKLQWMENWFDGLTYCKYQFPIRSIASRKKASYKAEQVT
jgi:hypothetical protein